jgi:hypothetical protein
MDLRDQLYTPVALFPRNIEYEAWRATEAICALLRKLLVA